MLKKIIAALTATTMLVLSGCSAPANSTAQSSKPMESKPQIIATLFPQYDFARQIAGDKADVTMLLAPGVESHSYDPTPADIIRINNADLFIYTGKNMESWVEKISETLESDTVKVLDISDGIELSASDLGDNDDHTVNDGHAHALDPHIWTDPNNAIIMTNNILAELVKIDPVNADYYTKNADDYKEKLKALDAEFAQVAANGTGKEIIFGGKNAFHYFLKRYNIKYDGAYNSCAAEAEPSVKTIARLIDKIKSENIKVIYYPELETPKVAQSISDETGAKMLLLHSAHNVTKSDFENGATYLSLMERNVDALKEGLK